jgi:hypothetical protein
MHVHVGNARPPVASHVAAWGVKLLEAVLDAFNRVYRLEVRAQVYVLNKRKAFMLLNANGEEADNREIV